MAKLSFISNETERIDLEEGTWIEVRKELSFEETKAIFATEEVIGSIGDNVKEQIAGTTVIIPLLQKTIVAWSDEDVPCTPENIAKLHPKTIQHLAELVMPKLLAEKKSSQK